MHNYPGLSASCPLHLHHSKIPYMKYQAGQVVTLLNTEFKPVGVAVIYRYEQDSNKYEVDFIYPNRQLADRVTVPEERLVPVAGN